MEGADAILQAVRDNQVRMMALAAGPAPEDPIKALIEEGAIGPPIVVYDSIRAIPPAARAGCQRGWLVR